MTKSMDGDEKAIRLGAIFRAQRRQAGLTLNQMAERMELSINTIRHHEAGTRLLRVTQMWRAAEILGCTPAKLLNTRPTKEKADAE